MARQAHIIKTIFNWVHCLLICLAIYSLPCCISPDSGEGEGRRRGSGERGVRGYHSPYPRTLPVPQFHQGSPGLSHVCTGPSNTTMLKINVTRTHDWQHLHLFCVCGFWKIYPTQFTDSCINKGNCSRFLRPYYGLTGSPR